MLAECNPYMHVHAIYTAVWLLALLNSRRLISVDLPGLAVIKER